jgi:hypothetical protein
MWAGLCWGFLFPAKNSWTSEKADRLSDVTGRAHVLFMKVKMAERDPSSLGEQDAKRLQEEYRLVLDQQASLKKEFESANDRPKTAARWMRWSGVALLLVGIGLSRIST